MPRQVKSYLRGSARLPFQICTVCDSSIVDLIVFLQGLKDRLVERANIIAARKDMEVVQLNKRQVRSLCGCLFVASRHQAPLTCSLHCVATALPIARLAMILGSIKDLCHACWKFLIHSEGGQGIDC